MVIRKSNYLLVINFFISAVPSVLYPIEQTKQKLYYHYLEAIFRHMKGDYNGAQKSFRQILSHKQAPMHAYAGYLRFLFDADEHAKIISVPTVVWDCFKDNIPMQMIRAQSFLQMNKTDQASTVLDHLITVSPDNEQILYCAVVSALQRGDTRQAESLINKALSNQNLSAKHFLFYFLRSKMLYAQRDYQKALDCAEKSVSLFPHFTKALLFKSHLQQHLGNINAAITGYQKFLDIVGSDQAIEKQLIHLLFSQNRFDDAAKQLGKITCVKKELKHAYYFDLALAHYKMSNTQKANTYIDKALKYKANFSKAQLLKTELLLIGKKEKKLLSFIHSWLQQQPDDMTAIKAIMLIKQAGISVKKIVGMLKKVIEQGYTNKFIFVVLADLQADMRVHSDALSSYKKALTIITDDAWRSKILFQIGYLYSKQKRWDKAEIALQKALGCHPVYPSVYNLLAYRYAQTDSQLEKALILIDRALQSSPGCPYYLDTKAYLLLKQAKPSEALSVLEQACTLAQKDKIIKSHIAMAHAALRKAK